MTTVSTFSLSQQTYNALYHSVDTRYNIDGLPPNLERRPRTKIKQQACSVACLVEKRRLLQSNNNGSIEYFIQSPPVLTLAGQVEGDYESEYKKYCADTAQPYDHNKAKLPFRGNFADELCLGEGTAFLIGKQLLLTAAHCICDSSTGVVSRVKLTSLLVLFGFQGHSSSHVFKEKDVYHIDAIWNYAYKKGVADWAIVKLDREVEGRDLLIFADSPTIQVKTQLYMLGHPLGLPLKVTMGAEVKERTKSKRTDETKDGDEPPLFDADLDAFAGNSGSPVFELEKGTIVAMLFAGNTMTFKNDEKAIYVPQVSQQIIDRYGYEKCLKIASIDFLKTVLSSSFKMGHTHFVGRIDQLLKLKAHFAHPSSSTKVHILYGPGGVGKSELAITFANQSIADFSFVWSISCGTEEEQRVGYQGLAQRLQVFLDERDTLHSLISKVHRKLEQNPSKPWLLLFDNLQRSPDTSELPPLPSNGGFILITSYKSPKIHSLPENVVVSTEILPLETIEALKFLEAVTEKSTNDCTKLLDHVGCYPLVLGQVASYIKHTKIEVEEYLANFEQCQSVLAVQESPSKAPKLEAAFNMTLQQLSPSAKKWLFLCSWLNAALIPASYLKAWLYSESLGEEQTEIVTALEEHALLRYNLQDDVFSLHLEFQRILKSIAPADIALQAAHLLVKVGEDWDFNNTSNRKETMKKATIWTSHVEPFVKAVRPESFDGLEKAFLLNKLGNWEEANASHRKALAYYDEALKIRRATLGENHLDVATSLSNIGSCYYCQGNYNGTVKMNSEALKINRAILGENHSDVAMNLNGIGSGYLGQNNCDEALNAYGKALKIRKATLGENHPDVAATLNNIGACYDTQRNYNGALKTYEEALKIRRAAWGENHPDVANSLTNIGSWHYSQSNFNEALKFYREALKVHRAALEENHPDVAMSLGNIGCCYYSKRNYNEALKFHSDALKIYKAINHREVASTLHNIEMCQEHLNKKDGACTIS